MILPFYKSRISPAILYKCIGYYVPFTGYFAHSNMGKQILISTFLNVKKMEGLAIRID
jgi:hypothetical protein